MESKDVALLGFVTSAKEFIDRHANDGTDLGELKNVDINKLKDELLGQLKFFEDKEKIETLIDAGAASFKEYANEKLQASKAVKELGNIFDVDFSSYDVVDNEESAEEKINDILDAYDVDKDTIGEEVKEETQEVVGEEPEDEDLTREIAEEANIQEEIEENPFPANGEPDEFGLTADDEFLKTIAANASKTDEELTNLNSVQEEKTLTPKVPDTMDQVLKEVVDNERSLKEELESLKASLKSIQEAIRNNAAPKTEQTIREAITSVKDQTKSEITSTMEAIEKQVSMLENIIAENNAEDNQQEAKPVEVKQEVKQTEEIKHATLSETLKEVSKISEVEVEQTLVNDYSNPVPVYKAPEEIKGPLSTVIKSFGQPEAAHKIDIIENPGLDIVLKQEEADRQMEEDIAEFTEEVEDEIENRMGVSESVPSNNNLDDLSVFVKKKKEYLKENKSLIEDDEKNRPIYANIKAVYPYLDDEFIKSAYSLKNDLSKNYKDGEKLILLHRATFVDIDKLHEFVEILIGHDYSVNVDEKKMIVDVFKELTNTEGIILTTIFTVANQAKVLYGTYEGYRIIKEEDD